MIDASHLRYELLSKLIKGERPELPRVHLTPEFRPKLNVPHAITMELPKTPRKLNRGWSGTSANLAALAETLVNTPPKPENPRVGGSIPSLAICVSRGDDSPLAASGSALPRKLSYMSSFISASALIHFGHLH